MKRLSDNALPFNVDDNPMLSTTLKSQLKTLETSYKDVQDTLLKNYYLESLGDIVHILTSLPSRIPEPTVKSKSGILYIYWKTFWKTVEVHPDMTGSYHISVRKPFSPVHRYLVNLPDALTLIGKLL